MQAQEQKSGNDIKVSEHHNTLLRSSITKQNEGPDINFNADNTQTISENIDAVRAHIKNNRGAGTQIIKCTLPGDGRTAYVEIDPKSLYVVGFDIYNSEQPKVDEQPQKSVRVAQDKQDVKSVKVAKNKQGVEGINYISVSNVKYNKPILPLTIDFSANDKKLLDTFGVIIAESIRFKPIQEHVVNNIQSTTIPDKTVNFIDENYLHNAQQDNKTGVLFNASTEPNQAMQYSDLIDNWSKLSKQTTLYKFIQNKVKQKDSSNSKDQSMNQMIQQKHVKHVKDEEQSQVGLIQQAGNFLALQIIAVPHINYKNDITLSKFFMLQCETTDGISTKGLLITKYQSQIDEIGNDLSEEQLSKLNAAIQDSDELSLKKLCSRQVQRGSKVSLKQEIEKLNQDLQDLQNGYNDQKYTSIKGIFERESVEDIKKRIPGLMKGYTEQLVKHKIKVDSLLSTVQTLQEDKVPLEEEKTAPNENKSWLQTNAKGWLQQKLSNYLQTLQKGLDKNSIPHEIKEIIKKHREMIEKLQSDEPSNEQWYQKQQTEIDALQKKFLQNSGNKQQPNQLKGDGNKAQQVLQAEQNATQSVAKKGSWWDKWKWKIAKIAGTISVAGMVGYLYNQYNQGGNINNNAANLKRDEKEKLKTTVTTNKQEYNFYTELMNANPEMQKKNLVELTALAEHKTKNAIPPHNQQNGAINKDKEAGKVALIAEKNHSVDHKTNVQMLVEKMEKGEMGAGTVVALERKEGGENLGMRDVRLLAEVLRHNEGKKDAEKIKLPAGIEGTALLWDAKLVNEAQKHGVQVVGVEGKCLAHGQQSPEYNADREDYMAQQLHQLKQQGYNVVMPVGEAHVKGLQSRLGANTAVDVMGTMQQNSQGKEHDMLQHTTTSTTKKIYGKFTERLAGGSSQSNGMA